MSERRRTTGDSESGDYRRERDRQDGSPEETGCDGPRHSLFTLRKRENLSGVGKWNRSLSRGVERREQEYEQRDGTDTRRTDVSRDEEAETCGKERPSHLWESEQQQATTSNYDEGISQLFDAD